MRIDIESFVAGFSIVFPSADDSQPWEVTAAVSALVEEKISSLNKNSYRIDNGIAIHKSATVEANAILKAPVIIGKNCFVAAAAYLRGGVYIGNNSRVGPGCEIKSSLIFQDTAVAHFNFIGDSIVGSNVNIEAGAVFANRYNERNDKTISVAHKGSIVNTQTEKFGALVGDGSRIGANSVLSPGTIIERNGIVNRLQLVEQIG